MNKRIVIILHLLVGITGMAGDTNQFEIIWAAPTNHLPSSVWIYKIIPENFSAAVASNLLALGAFTEKDETRVENQPPSSRFFNTQDGTRKLGILPTYGVIFYEDKNAKVSIPKHEHPSNVPSHEQTYQLGQELLQKLGIDRSQLATKSNNIELYAAREEDVVGRYDKARQTNSEEVISRSVDFVRRVNGISFDGLVRGGASFEFGNNGKLARMQVVWKGLEPHELRPTLKPDQLIEELRAGKGKWIMPIVYPVKTITIMDVQPLYRGILAEDDEHKFLEPYIWLEVRADNGITNVISDFACSIIQ